MNEKNIILTVDVVEPELVAAVHKLSKQLGVTLKGIVLISKYYADVPSRPRDTTGLFTEIFCDFDNPDEIQTLLKPYKDHLLAATCRYEQSIGQFRKLVPFIPYVLTPTESSLKWASEKHIMRDRLRCYDEKLVPKYCPMESYDQKKVEKIIADFSFPMIVKPDGLMKSLLVTQVNNEMELEQCLRHTFAVIQDVYDQEHLGARPKVLVEEMMQGPLYSIDAYIDQKGTTYCAPLVEVVIANDIGLPGFYSYETLTPARTSEHEAAVAEKVARAAVEALNLRSTSAHIELIRSAQGWKIVELGARLGGYRADLYQHAYGIDHFYNDLLIKIGMQPQVTNNPIGYASVINIYGEEEGIFSGIQGVEAVEQLESVLKLTIDLPLGQISRFADKGGQSIVNVTLGNKDQEALRRDIAKARELIQIEITPAKIPEVTHA